ncbi:MAG TPA: SUMF1/EgtB/PvdO family nonheme iron enzyme [Polyangiaceae bacterium]|nr:SUMF1/EgtB/PvdO family nonheme iron enzyme [Polyangiaceae bacterium]
MWCRRSGWLALLLLQAAACEKDDDAKPLAQGGASGNSARNTGGAQTTAGATARGGGSGSTGSGGAAMSTGGVGSTGGQRDGSGGTDNSTLGGSAGAHGGVANTESEGGATGGAGGETGETSTAGESGAGGADPGSEPPSCRGLPESCGSGAQDCCSNTQVPGGTFNRSNDVAAPATVSAFNLDVFEVTVGRMRRFVEAYPGSRPSAGSGKNPHDAGDPGWNLEWDRYLPASRSELIGSTGLSCGSLQTWTDEPGDNENRPIVCATWYVAYAFCIWDGGRLPTEAEWNFAASGGSAQLRYPWARSSKEQTLDATYANYVDSNHCVPNCSAKDLFPVGSLPLGIGRFGQLDLAGNVREWVADVFSENYPTPCVDCAYRGAGPYRVLRGGSWGDTPNNLLTSARSSDLPEYHPGNLETGFRCAR